MRVLVRYITRKARTGVTHSDHEIHADTLTIGRGSDADLFLSDLHVALRHAILRDAGDGRFTIQARTPSGIRINGRTMQTGSVRAEDTIEIGLTSLRLQRGDAEHDLVIDVEERQSRSDEAVDVGATSLQEAGLGYRRWAWTAFFLVMLLGIGIPLGHLLSEKAATAKATDNSDDGSGGIGSRLLTTIPWHLAGGDQLWDSGPMSRPHRFFGRDCGQCHQEPFQRVTSEACLACHEDQPHHADDAELMHASGLSGRRCADCHREHGGLEAMVGTDPRLCVDCHADPDGSMPESDIRPVTGFMGDSHPPFRVRLVSITDAGEADWQRVRMTDAVSERNGLVFPHDVHVSEDGVRGPTGREQLVCADCHRPGPEGVAMQPPSFEQDCQRCHRLDFSAGDVERELPHGDPESVLVTLEEYFARVALEGGFTDEAADPPEVVRQRRPGDEQLEPQERQAALEWSRQWAHTVAEESFEYRTCRTCHEIERQPESKAGWRVAPVALTREWFPAHRFDHDPHRKTDCMECHAADTSARSEDVLMPGIETCRQCHGDSDSTARVASRCVDCHAFHAADELDMAGHGSGLRTTETD